MTERGRQREEENVKSRERKVRKIPREREREEWKKGKKEGDEMTTGRGGMRLRERWERGRWEARERERERVEIEGGIERD